MIDSISVAAQDRANHLADAGQIERHRQIGR
jgi:hypothetical protein